MMHKSAIALLTLALVLLAPRAANAIDVVDKQNPTCQELGAWVQLVDENVTEQHASHQDIAMYMALVGYGVPFRGAVDYVYAAAGVLPAPFLAEKYTRECIAERAQH